MLLLVILTLSTIPCGILANVPSNPGDPYHVEDVTLVGRNLTWEPSNNTHEYGVFVYKNGQWEEVETVNEPSATVWDHQLKYKEKEQKGTFPVKIVAKNTISGKTAESNKHFKYYWPNEDDKGCSFLPQTDDMKIFYESDNDRVDIDESAEQISRIVYGSIARIESEGYKLSRTCSDDAIWSEIRVDEIPCLKKCGILTASPGTKIVYSPEVVAGTLTPSGTRATIVCATGLVDDNLSHKIVSCADGEWTPAPAHCVSTCMQRLESDIDQTVPQMKTQVMAALTTLDIAKQCKLADLAQLLASRFDASLYGPYLESLLKDSGKIDVLLGQLNGKTDQQVIDFVTSYLSNQPAPPPVMLGDQLPLGVGLEVGLGNLPGLGIQSTDAVSRSMDQNQCVDAANNCARVSVCKAAGEEGYNGSKSTTVTGLSCKMWKDEDPDKADYMNYCRNFDGWGAPWCYTDESEQYGGNTWEFCFQYCPVEDDCVQRVTAAASSTGMNPQYLEGIPYALRQLTTTQQCQSAQLAELLQKRMETKKFYQLLKAMMSGQVSPAELLQVQTTFGNDEDMLLQEIRSLIPPSK